MIRRRNGRERGLIGVRPKMVVPDLWLKPHGRVRRLKSRGDIAHPAGWPALQCPSAACDFSRRQRHHQDHIFQVHPSDRRDTRNK